MRLIYRFTIRYLLQLSSYLSWQLINVNFRYLMRPRKYLIDAIDTRIESSKKTIISLGVSELCIHTIVWFNPILLCVIRLVKLHKVLVYCDIGNINVDAENTRIPRSNKVALPGCNNTITSIPATPRNDLL